VREGGDTFSEPQHYLKCLRGTPVIMQEKGLMGKPSERRSSLCFNPSLVLSTFWEHHTFKCQKKMKGSNGLVTPWAGICRDICKGEFAAKRGKGAMIVDGRMRWGRCYV